MTSTNHDVQVQFICEVPAHEKPFFEQHKAAATAAMSATLLGLFDLPVQTPAEMLVKYTNRWQLLEANSTLGHPRVPLPAEVMGAFLGVAVTLHLLLDPTWHSSATDLKGPRQHDA